MDSSPTYPAQFLRGVALATGDERFTQAAERMERMERALKEIDEDPMATDRLRRIVREAVK